MRVTYDFTMNYKLERLQNYREIIDAGYINLIEVKRAVEKEPNLSHDEIMYSLFVDWLRKEFKCAVRNNINTISINLSTYEPYKKFKELKRMMHSGTLTHSNLVSSLCFTIHEKIISIADNKRDRPTGDFIYFSKSYKLTKLIFNKLLEIKDALTTANRLFDSIMENSEEQNKATEEKDKESRIFPEDELFHKNDEMENFIGIERGNRTSVLQTENQTNQLIIDQDLQRRVNEAMARRRNA